MIKDYLKLKYVPYVLLIISFAFTMTFPDWVRDNEMLLTVTFVPAIVLSFLFSQPKDEEG